MCGSTFIEVKTLNIESTRLVGRYHVELLSSPEPGLMLTSLAQLSRALNMINNSAASGYPSSIPPLPRILMSFMEPMFQQVFAEAVGPVLDNAQDYCSWNIVTEMSRTTLTL